MGKFDGILICSDWDGTLHTAKGVSENNIKAINYFQSEGGLFTVCTGRRSDHLNDLIRGFQINTYTISINGAQIIDQRSGHILYEGFFDKDAAPLAKKIFDLAEEEYFFTVFYKDHGEVVIKKIITYEEFTDIFNSYPVYKLVYSGTLASVLKAKKELINLGEYKFIRSWETGIELLRESNTKGKAAERLKRETGSRLLVAVGNYENDIDMFNSADLSYAVEGSCEEAIAAATKTTVSAEDGAISAVIFDIENNILPSFNT
jgi:HAD superfamily hydrolase (TIGR01484 family)